MGFIYIFIIFKDGKMGFKDKFGNWNGLIEYIVNKVWINWWNYKLYVIYFLLIVWKVRVVKLCF